MPFINTPINYSSLNALTSYWELLQNDVSFTDFFFLRWRTFIYLFIYLFIYRPKIISLPILYVP
jgi:hypothetical protein